MYVQDHLQGPATLLSIYLTGLLNVKNIGGEKSVSSLVGITCPHAPYCMKKAKKYDEISKLFLTQLSNFKNI